MARRKRRGPHLRQSHEHSGEFVGAEIVQVVQCFARSQEFYGDAEALINAQQEASLCGAIHFGDYEPCNAKGRRGLGVMVGVFFSETCELLCLPKGVLPRVPIQHQQDLIGVSPEGFGGHAEDLFQFRHKTEARVLASCGIRKDVLYVSSACGFYCGEDDGRGVTFGCPFDDLHVQAFRPHLDLLGGSRPEGIPTCEQDRFPRFFQAMGEFRHRGGLTGAVGSHEKIHGGGMFGHAQGSFRICKSFSDEFQKGAPEVFGLVSIGVFSGVIPEFPQEVFGFYGTRVSKEEGFFQVFKKLFIHLPSGEEGIQAFFEARKDFEGHIMGLGGRVEGE